MWEDDLLGWSNGGQFHMREGPPGMENRSHIWNSTPGAFLETARHLEEKAFCGWGKAGPYQRGQGTRTGQQGSFEVVAFNGSQIITLRALGLRTEV